MSDAFNMTNEGSSLPVLPEDPLVPKFNQHIITSREDQIFVLSITYRVNRLFMSI